MTTVKHKYNRQTLINIGFSLLLCLMLCPLLGHGDLMHARSKRSSTASHTCTAVCLRYISSVNLIFLRRETILKQCWKCPLVTSELHTTTKFLQEQQTKKKRYSRNISMIFIHSRNISLLIQSLCFRVESQRGFDLVTNYK